MVEQLLQQLLTLLRADTSYFASRVPIIKEIATILLAVGWALLIGNLAYQALRSMVSGVGIEAEDPTRLFLRTAMFSFLLVCARQICNIGLSLTAVIMRLLQMPRAVSFTPFDEDFFSLLPNAGWLVVIVVNVYVQWQIIKLFFEVAERYVILCTLVYCAPLAFAMGGSKSTAEIFRGWLRMFASMCTLMALNVMFVKMLLSAMSNSPTGVAIVPWVMLITGIVRTAKKIDSIILRIGLNPASTGDPLGHHHIPGMLSALMFHHAAEFIKNTISNPPHATNTMQPRYFDPLAYGIDRQVTTGRVAEIGASSGASTQTASAENNNNADSTTNVSRSAGTMPQRTASVHAPHQYADINIDADDFIDGESVSHVSSTTQEVSSRVSPIAPHVPPLPHNFAETKPPISPQTGRPPITPQTQHTSNTTQTAQNAPQNIVQNANAQNVVESQLAEHSMEQTSTLQPQTIEHSTQTENNSGTHGQQAGRISPVTPPRPAMTHESSKTEHNTAAYSSTQVQSVNDQKAIHHVQNQTSDKSAPIMPNVSQATPIENTQSSAPAPQRTAKVSDRTVTPVAAQKAVSPAKPNITEQRASVQAVKSDAISQRTPVQTTKPDATSRRTPAHAAKPDVTPQRNRGVSAAVRPDISPVAAQNPTVKPQQNRSKSRNPTSPISPASQPHTLRRTAEPVKRKDVMPRNGGNRNARRKRKP
ncbi:hypothetical protein [Agathobaculum butyriciproducens]|uniref:hypothetical protein n=1 Tax=Agathobaculum butyriciproducens TaxID=1628085 RepID=UPI003AB2E24B